VAVSSAETEASTSTNINHICSIRKNLTSVESSSTSTSSPLLMHDEIKRISSSDPLQNASTLVVQSNNTGQGGISIFRGYYFCHPNLSAIFFCQVLFPKYETTHVTLLDMNYEDTVFYCSICFFYEFFNKIRI
jgi:hypothetical protein